MRILLLSLSLALLLSISSAARSNHLSNLASILQLSSKWPDLIAGLNKAQTGGEAIKGVLQFLKQNYRPDINVDGIYQELENSQYGPQLNAGFKYSNDFSKLTQGLMQILLNSQNSPSSFLDIARLILDSGVLDYNAFTQPPPPPPNATQNPLAGPFLQNAFKNFTRDFFANLLGTLTPEQLQMIISNTIKQSLTPEIISGLKQIIVLINPQLGLQLQNINNPDDLYPLLQSLLDQFVMQTYLDEMLSYFGLDLQNFFGTPSGLTTSAPSMEYISSLKSMLDLLNGNKLMLQMGTQQSKALYLGMVLMQYPIVSQTLQNRLQATRPDVYAQIQQFLKANDSTNAVITIIPYLPGLLSNDLQTLKQQYNADYTDLLQNYILPINPSTIQPPATTAGTNPPLTQQTTRPPTTPPPPPATTQSTPPSTTRPPTTPPPPPATTQSTPPPTTPSTTRPPTTPPPTTPSTTRPPTTPPPTTPSTTRPPTTPPPSTASTTFDFWSWLNNLATTTSSPTTQRITVSGETTQTTRKPIWG